MQLHALVSGAAEVVGSEVTLTEAAARMVEAEVGCLAVVSGRRLVGILTDHDMVKAIADDLDPDEALVTAVMSEAPDTVPPDLTVHEAAAWFLEAGYRHLPVMDDDELLGIVSIKDILWALVETE